MLGMFLPNNEWVTSHEGYGQALDTFAQDALWEGIAESNLTTLHVRVVSNEGTLHAICHMLPVIFRVHGDVVLAISTVAIIDDTIYDNPCSYLLHAMRQDIHTRSLASPRKCTTPHGLPMFPLSLPI